MTSVPASLAASGRRRLVFSVVVLFTLGLFGLIGVVLLFPHWVTGLLGHQTASHISGHFRLRHHRVHDFTFGFLFATAAVGMVAQLRAPLRNVAGQLMALIPWAGLILAFVLTNTWVPVHLVVVFLVVTLIAAALHPAGSDRFSFLGVSRVNRVLVVLVIIAAVPLLAFAATNIALQRTVIGGHAALGHYGFMAAVSFTVIGTGLLASLRPPGWKLTAWVAGILTALLGTVSLVYPDNDSSLGLFWAVAAIAWGAGFVAAAERTEERNSVAMTPARP